jgi:hypothetical protein
MVESTQAYWVSETILGFTGNAEVVPVAKTEVVCNC